MLTGNVARLLATLAVIIVGIAWMFGYLDLRKAGYVVIGVAISSAPPRWSRPYRGPLMTWSPMTESVRLTEDTLFLACTRPAMVGGVTMEAMALNVMFS